MQNLNQFNLALFLTRGFSLKKWKEIGILEREIQPYFELAKNFEKIFIFSYGDKNERSMVENLPKNIEIVFNNTFLPSSLYGILLPIIHKKIFQKIDILKTNQMDGSWAAVITKKLFGNKLVIRSGYEWLQYLENTNSSWWKRKIAYGIEKYAYGAADKILITSPGGKKFITDTFKVKETKIEIIPNYIDTDKFKPLDIKRESNKVVFVGRLEPVKNILNMVKACVGIDVELTIVGGGSQREEIKELAFKNNIKVDFKGIVSQDDLPHVLNSNSICILASLSEGNPKSLLEAMSCGLTCIGSNIEGITSIIKDKENGIICGTDVESINLSMRSLLADKDLLVRLGRNARNSILNEFSLEKVIEKELTLYKTI